MTEPERKKMKYACPCGFASYDLMEFLKHPFQGSLNKHGQEVTERPEEGNQDGASTEAPGEDIP